MGIFALISAAIWGFGRDIFFLNSNLNSSLSSQFYARQVLRKIVTELRSASPSSLGAYPLASVSTSSITFYSDVDADLLKEQIRYFVQGNELKRGTTRPSGSPLTYNIANETIDTIVGDLYLNPAVPIFDYYDQYYAGTSSPLTIPVNVLAVRFIKITLPIDTDPNRLPLPITATSQVMLRNLKDNF